MTQATLPADITVSELMRHLSEDEMNELMALADQVEDMRRKIGDMVRVKVEQGWPVNQTCVLISMMTKKGLRSVREYLYCSQFVASVKDKRDRKWLELCDWAIINYARKTDNPMEVIRAHVNEGYTVEELKQMYPKTKSDPVEALADPRPAWIKPILRWIGAKLPPTKQTEARRLVDMLLGALKEMEE